MYVVDGFEFQTKGRGKAVEEREKALDERQDATRVDKIKILVVDDEKQDEKARA